MRRQSKAKTDNVIGIKLNTPLKMEKLIEDM